MQYSCRENYAVRISFWRHSLKCIPRIFVRNLGIRNSDCEILRPVHRCVLVDRQLLEFAPEKHHSGDHLNEKPIQNVYLQRFPSRHEKYSFLGLFWCVNLQLFDQKVYATFLMLFFDLWRVEMSKRTKSWSEEDSDWKQEAEILFNETLSRSVTSQAILCSNIDYHNKNCAKISYKPFQGLSGLVRCKKRKEKLRKIVQCCWMLPYINSPLFIDYGLTWLENLWILETSVYRWLNSWN